MGPESKTISHGGALMIGQLKPVLSATFLIILLMLMCGCSGGRGAGSPVMTDPAAPQHDLTSEGSGSGCKTSFDVTHAITMSKNGKPYFKYNMTGGVKVDDQNCDSGSSNVNVTFVWHGPKSDTTYDVPGTKDPVTNGSHYHGT
jgi:hypothetical protein